MGRCPNTDIDPVWITLYTLTQYIYILHTALLHFLWYRQGEFVKQSKLLRLATISFILTILINKTVVLL